VGFFSFPNPVNDAAARTVAAGVVTMGAITFVTGWTWLLVLLTYGFLARVLAGPTISPLGQFAVRVAAPRLPTLAKFVPGPPKRFAQGIGLTFMIATDVLTWTNGWSVGRWILLPLIAAASLEAFLGYCLGCTIFSLLIRAGLVPASVCVECGDIEARRQRLARENASA
jgi:hypothetical protein